MCLERVAEFEIDVEHGVAFVAAELLEPGGMDAALHAGAQRTPLEAVAAEDVRIEAGGFGPALDNAGHGAGIDRGIAKAGQGGIPAGAAAR